MDRAKVAQDPLCFAFPDSLRSFVRRRWVLVVDAPFDAGSVYDREAGKVADGGVRGGFVLRCFVHYI